MEADPSMEAEGNAPLEDPFEGESEGAGDHFALPSISSPSATQQRRRKNATTGESLGTSKLFRDISPTRVFTMKGATATSASLPDLFKQKNALASLRPAYLQAGDDDGQDAGRAPRLLAR